MTTSKLVLEDLGDGIVVGAPNRDGQVTISDAATGVTLGRAFGATADALNGDIALKVGLIRADRAAVADVAKAAEADLLTGRDKLLAALRTKATPATPPVTSEGSTNG